jgi:hypothetical protein
MERRFTDDQLTQMNASDHGELRAIGAACTARHDVAPESPPITAALPGGEPTPIAIYITPYYNSSGPAVEVGPFSKGLASKDEHTFVATILKMKSAWSTLSFPELYVGAIRLYDFGYRQEAVYWFYSAQYRGRQFSMLIDHTKMGSIGDPGFELYHAQDAFFQLAGPAINGYAFGDVDALTGIIRRVQSENREVPDLAAIYPDVRFTNKAEWSAKNVRLNAGLGQLASTLATQKGAIKQQRASNGTEAEYGKLTSKKLPAGP